MTSTSAVPARGRAAVFLAVTVLVVAANLRASITSVGPVLDLIADDTGLGSSALGILGAIPLFAFAAVSPIVDRFTRRFGRERTVLAATILLVAATVWRSVPGWIGNLWLGTALIGAAIAVGNVLVPALVKRDFPERIALLTGLYSAVLSVFAGVASGVAQPIGESFGWRIAVGCWALLSVVAALVWLPRLRGTERPDPAAVRAAGAQPSMWTSATAWQVAGYMAAQSTVFYLLVTWLPTIEAATGVEPVVAGWHLFLFQAVGVLAGLAVTALLHGRGDLRAVAAAVAALMLVGMLGFLLAPDLVVAWVVVAGLGSGASLVVALTLIAQRARGSVAAARLSGMAQGVGYLVAAFGPIGAGVLLDATGDWRPVVWVVAGLAGIQALIGLFAGRDRYTHPRPEDASPRPVA